MMLPTDAAMLMLKSRFPNAGMPPGYPPIKQPGPGDRFYDLEQTMIRMEAQVADVQRRLNILEDKLKDIDPIFRKGNDHASP